MDMSESNKPSNGEPTGRIWESNEEGKVIERFRGRKQVGGDADGDI